MNVHRGQGGKTEQLAVPNVVPTPATDSDLNELLSILGSEIKMLRRENKMLAGHNMRLTVVLAERGVVAPPQTHPVDPITLGGTPTLPELASELQRRIALLGEESAALKEENSRLTSLASGLDLPDWRIEETRVGSSRLVPGTRAFIRRRRVEPSRLRGSGSDT
ncbi:MAG: hypothetical protein J2P38_09960 [Candidatus Dormibacteraeota bacterium]|nr:hypothetical protein [Candidatus Dormibacteraeota bacterium]